VQYSIQINEGPYTHQASDSALKFAQAALAKGHEVVRVFFYHDGVNQANRLADPPSDDRNLTTLWSQFAEQNDVDLVVCVAAALRRGIDDSVIAPPFRISGLGQLVEAAIMSDRHIVFGD
jgi:tRNA 2-thiouridine synthesizing protein D